MKNSVFTILLFLIASLAQGVIAQDSTYIKPQQRLKFAPEKEARIKMVAQKIAREMAPDFKSDTLVPVIFSHGPVSFKKNAKADKKVIEVLFMKHENDYFEYEKGSLDPITKRPTGKYERIKSPKYVLSIILYEDTLEPLFISDSHSRWIEFEPSYTKFRAKNPNKRLEPYVWPEGEYIVF